LELSVRSGPGRFNRRIRRAPGNILPVCDQIGAPDPFGPSLVMEPLIEDRISPVAVW
jgi:hypothetical protein